MGILEKLGQGNKGAGSTRAESEPVKISIPYEVDAITCRKAGVLAGYGLVDTAIADALLLSREQVNFAKQTPEFKAALSKQTQERAQRLIDLEEGWDSLEERALTVLHETFTYNRDPRFALQAAFTANKANRRTPGSNGRVIDATKTGNVIMLTMNKTFVTNVSSEESRGVINVTPREADKAALPKRQHDIPTPKRVGELLSIDKGANKTMKDEIMDQLAVAGVTLDMIEED